MAKSPDKTKQKYIQQQKIIDNFYHDIVKKAKIILQDDKIIQFSESSSLIDNNLTKEKLIYFRITLLRLITLKIVDEWLCTEENLVKPLLEENSYNFDSLIINFFDKVFKKFDFLSFENLKVPEEKINNFNIFQKNLTEKTYPEIQISKIFISEIWVLLQNYSFKTYSEDNLFSNNINLETLSYIFEKTIKLIEENQLETGSYYTPKEITDFIAQETLDRYLKDLLQVNSLLTFKDETVPLDLTKLNKKEFFDINKFLIKELKRIKVLDPACGTGAFIISMADELLKKYKIIYANLGYILNFNVNNESYTLDESEQSIPQIKKYIIENNLFGVDIQESTLEMCRLLLWLWYMDINYNEIKPLTQNFKLNLFMDVKKHFIIENTLTGLQKTSFGISKNDEGFNIILGNPPYLGESGHKITFDKLKILLSDYYEAKMDYWYFFLFKSLELVKKNGYISFITSNYWKTATGASKLRKNLFNDTSIKLYIDFLDNKIFSNANGVHSNILFVQKANPINNFVSCFIYNNTYDSFEGILEKRFLQSYFTVKQNSLMNKFWNDYILFNDDKTNEIFSFLTKNAQKLHDLFFSIQGVVTGLNKITNSKIKKFNLKSVNHNDGVFILDPKQKNDYQFLSELSLKDKNLLFPLYKSSNIKQYKLTQTDLQILYLDNNSSLDHKDPVYRHLLKFKPVLETRREVRNKRIEFFQLQWPRDYSTLRNPKIIHSYRAEFNNFTFSYLPIISTQDTYFILDIYRDHNREKSLLAILNSELAFFYFYNFGKKKGNAIELFGEPIENFPIASLFSNFHVYPLVDYILYLKMVDSNNGLVNFLLHLIEYLVYELYIESFNGKKVLKLQKICKEHLTEINLENWIIKNGLFNFQNNSEFDKIINEFSLEIKSDHEYNIVVENILKNKNVEFITNFMKNFR